MVLKSMSLLIRMVDENMKMTDCYYETKDWRKCAKEVRMRQSPFYRYIKLTIKQMQAFRECWKRNGNVQRTDQKDV